MGAWAEDAERRALGSSSQWAYGGQYGKPRADNILLCAIYGIDLSTGEGFSWENYSEEYAKRVVSSSSALDVGKSLKPCTQFELPQNILDDDLSKASQYWFWCVMALSLRLQSAQ